MSITNQHLGKYSVLDNGNSSVDRHFVPTQWEIRWPQPGVERKSFSLGEYCDLLFSLSFSLCTGDLDPSKYSINDMFKVNYLVMEYLLMDEQTQICGVVFLSDTKDITLSHVAQMTPTVAKKSMISFQVT